MQLFNIDSFFFQSIDTCKHIFFLQNIRYLDAAIENSSCEEIQNPSFCELRPSYIIDLFIFDFRLTRSTS